MLLFEGLSYSSFSQSQINTNDIIFLLLQSLVLFQIFPKTLFDKDRELVYI